MKLPKSFTTVTPLSKSFALFIFIALPIASFYFGQMTAAPNPTPEVPQPINASPLPKKKDCGELPEVVKNFVSEEEKTLTFNPIQGVDWSVNCRYVAISTLDVSNQPHLNLYRIENDKLEEIKPPEGSSPYSGIRHTRWDSRGCLETEIAINGVTGTTKIFYKPGGGFDSGKYGCT